MSHKGFPAGVALNFLLGFAITLVGCHSASAPSSAAQTEAQPYNRAEGAPATANSETTSGERRSRSRNHSAADSSPGAFDFYLLNLSWSPEFCATHNASPECGSHPGFVVHGLWPQNNDGTYPEKCSNAPGPANPGAYTDVLPTASLVEHEWATHGTCSGLAPDAYFGLIRRAFHSVKIPAMFTNPTQSAMEPPSAILDSFARINVGFPPPSLALSCGNNNLTAVEVCMDKNLNPEACQGVRTCRANTVKITPR